MSAAPPEKVASTEESLDKSVRLYREMGFSDARIVSVMVRSGYPLAAIQQRFPNICVSTPATLPQQPAFGTPNHLAAARPETRSPSPSSGLVAIGESPGLHSLLNRVGSTNTAVSRPDGARTADSPPPPNGPEGLSFQYVPLIQCTFPHGDPGDQTLFSRRNGRLLLTLSTARPDAGLPYGVPARLLTIYCASEVKRTKSPQIDLGGSLHDFLRRLDVPITRGERGSLRVYANQLLRLIHCAISVDEDIEDDSGRQGLHLRQTLFVDEARLWWDDDAGTGQGSFLLLSPSIFNSILKRSAPLSTRAIRALRKSPMDLDVYAWLVHRLYRRAEPSTVSWTQLFGQFGHSYGELRYFRRFFCVSLTKAMQAYPQARVNVTDTGLLLLPSKPHVEPRAEGQE